MRGSVFSWLVLLACVGASVVATMRSRRSCDHQWGHAERDAGWDQRCVKCGAWRSGYGDRW